MGQDQKKRNLDFDMDNEVIDDFLEFDNSKYSKKAFFAAFVFLGAFAINAGLTYLSIIDGIGDKPYSYCIRFLIFVYLGISIYGIVAAINSLKYREPNSTRKIIGLVGGLLMFLLWVLLFGSMFFDIAKYF